MTEHYGKPRAKDQSGKYTVFPTVLGWMGVAYTDRGVFASVLPRPTEEEAESAVKSQLPFQSDRLALSPEPLVIGLQAYFRGERVEMQFTIDWSWATPFQKKVLQTVCAIPRGSCLTYGEVARIVGSPNGARAVGGALAANLIPIIVPCHRVIRGNGGLGGYTGAGLEVKAHLLHLEGVNLR